MDKSNRGYGVISLRAIRPLALAAATLAVLAVPAFAAGPERSLAGIAIFSPGSQVTRKFGNPSQILVGGAAPASATGTQGGPGGQGGFPGASGGQGSFPGASGGQGGFPGASGGYPGASGGFSKGIGSGASTLPGFSGSSGGFPGASGGFPGASGGFPGASGGFPGASGGFPGASGGFPGASGGSGFPGGAASTAPVKPPVTLVYNRANGGSLEFTISPDKRVVQIRETGYVGAYGTSRGIKLGMSYSAVVAKYGYQENTMIDGSIINIDYKDTLHCGFQFLDQKLVAIIVSSPD